MLNIITATTVIEQYTTWDLADLAECSANNNTAEEWLNLYRDVILNRAEESIKNGYTLTDDDIAEMADNAVPVYTAEKWELFQGLSAQCEDVSDYLPEGTTDAEEIATIAIYLIAERLLTALNEIIELNAEEIEDEEETIEGAE